MSLIPRRHVGQQERHTVLELSPVDHHVDHAVLEQELGGLEALREARADRLLHKARSGEPDERTGLGDQHVT